MPNRKPKPATHTPRRRRGPAPEIPDLFHPIIVARATAVRMTLVGLSKLCPDISRDAIALYFDGRHSIGSAALSQIALALGLELVPRWGGLEPPADPVPFKASTGPKRMAGKK